MSTFNEITVEPLPTGYRAYREGDDPEEDSVGIGLTPEDAKQDLIDWERNSHVR